MAEASPTVPPSERPDGACRVVRVIARLNVGGPALHAIHLSRGLEARFPTILAVGEVGAGEADMSDGAAARGVRMERVPGLGRAIRPLDDLRACLHLFRLFRRVRPAAVHTHTAKAGALGRIAAVAARVPVRIHTFHGHVFHGYFGAFTTRLILMIERMLARATTRIIAISESQAHDLTVRYRVCDPDQVVVVPLGLELERLDPARSAPLRPGFREEIGAADGQVVITIVGRLVAIKDHDLFLEAAALVDRAEGGRCIFLVVGGGPEEPRLRRRARELGLGGKVRFLGWREDTDRIYAGSDVVVLTSRNEGTPVCLIEAMAAGVPVVATDVGGVRDVLEDGRLGALVPAGDAEAVADAIADAIADVLERPDAADEAVPAGVGAMRRRFGVDRLLEDMAALYAELGVEPAPVTATSSPGSGADRCTT